MRDDSAYGAMMDAIQNAEAPSFCLMQHDLATWSEWREVPHCGIASPFGALTTQCPPWFCASFASVGFWGSRLPEVS